MSKMKKVTEGEEGEEEEEEGGGGGGKTFSIVITSSRCKLFCSLLQLVFEGFDFFFLQVTACCSVFFKGLISFRESAKVPVVHGRNIVPLFFWQIVAASFLLIFEFF